ARRSGTCGARRILNEARLPPRRAFFRADRRSIQPCRILRLDRSARACRRPPRLQAKLFLFTWQNLYHSIFMTPRAPFYYGRAERISNEQTTHLAPAKLHGGRRRRWRTGALRLRRRVGANRARRGAKRRH